MAALVWDGMTEYVEALRALPEECEAEAAREIETAVAKAFSTIAGVYDAHRFTGTLRSRLKIVTADGGLALVSGSPLAWLFDHGSQVRHYYTVNGKKKAVGRMPANPVFSRSVARERRLLTKKFEAMLLRRGAATVTVT